MVHALLMRPIGRSRNVVRMLAATLVPEHCSSGHRGKLCRWSHLISSAEGQRNCWPTLKAVSCYPICQVSVVPSAPSTAPDRSCSAPLSNRTPSPCASGLLLAASSNFQTGVLQMADDIHRTSPDPASAALHFQPAVTPFGHWPMVSGGWA